jgi:hypothetical protein
MSEVHALSRQKEKKYNFFQSTNINDGGGL